jgi:hypothetical protein
MKKVLLILVISAGMIKAQDVTITVMESYKDTLTATLDTMVVYMQTKHEYVSVSLYTTTGIDTVLVDCMDKFGGWVNRSLIDLTDAFVYSSMIITTTPKEFLIYDPEIWAIRFRTADVSASTVFKVFGKRAGK